MTARGAEMDATPEKIQALRDKACWLRRETVRHSFGVAHHLGGSLSCIEILVACYYGVMSPAWRAGRQVKFVLSKGHACIPLYIILADLGLIDGAELRSIMKMGGALLGHPCRQTTRGIDVSTGSLGQGLSIALGMALGARATNDPLEVFVLLGDSELQSGQVAEALLFLAQRGLTNVRVIVDANGLQTDGFLTDIVNVEPLAHRLGALALDVHECDGHDIAEILHFLRREASRPPILVARTVKGKGVPFMENNVAWHSGSFPADSYEQAMRALDRAEND